MATRDYFSANYREARAKFRDAAVRAGAVLTTFVNPKVKGPGGEELATDVARLGPQTADRVLITVSATHGAEGFCGSGAQIGSFEAGLGGELPPAYLQGRGTWPGSGSKRLWRNRKPFAPAGLVVRRLGENS